jgi:hypothetical protein
MSNDPENLTLIYLHRLDGKLDSVTEVLRDHSRRLTTLEVAVGNFAATEMSHHAHLAMRADRTDERLDRIERRLDLREA